MSNEPVGIFLLPDGDQVAHKIKRNEGSKYFVKNTKKVKGIFKINGKYRRRWGKTPIYYFAAQETNTIDPVLIDKLNGWKRQNSLAEIKRKDVKHGSKLRTLLKQKKGINELKKEEALKAAEIKDIVADVGEGIDRNNEKLGRLHNKNINSTNAEKGIILLEHLKEIGKLDENEFVTYMDKVEKNTYTFDMLMDEMKEKHDVHVSESLDLETEDFIQDLGSQDAPSLAGFCQDIIKGKRGLRDLTPAPVKSFLSGGIIIALMVGGAVVIAVVAPYITGQASLPASGAGGLKMPWDMFGGQFLFGLKSMFGVG